MVGAALKLIGEHGMAGLTTAALAKEVGISEANIYRHFENKNEILRETVKRIGEGLRHNVEIAVDSSSTPMDRLRRVFQLHLAYVRQNRGIPRLLFSDEMYSDKGDLKSALLEAITGYLLSLEHMVRECRESGAIKQSVDPKAMAMTFVGMIQVSIIRWILSDFTLSIEDEGGHLWSNYEMCISEPLGRKRKKNIKEDCDG